MYLKSNERNAAPQNKFLKFLYLGSLGKWECFDVIWPYSHKIAGEMFWCKMVGQWEERLANGNVLV